MGGRVAGGLPLALDDLAVQIDDDHILDRHPLIGYARGLDDHKARLPVNTGDIAPGEGHETIFGQEEIRLTDFAFQFFQHLRSPRSLPFPQAALSYTGSEKH